ncbi:methyltransferase PMT10 [Pyrus ussuriensis x Pyrus communis]|uniref:Methyltransferase PMT10 n=1 Tax=Pyrus ussuriensis x Pyrus communis TaxID=2448454 RepID=A0A5N5G459_9ROSA|nr:methyltransferase PMT10 [Pyrus ussuriensis x Pyrus communis]
MSAFAATATDMLKTPTCTKITTIALISLSLFLLANHYSATYPSLPFFSSTATSSAAQFSSLASQTLESHVPNPPSAPYPPLP